MGMAMLAKSVSCKVLRFYGGEVRKSPSITTHQGLTSLDISHQIFVDHIF